MKTDERDALKRELWSRIDDRRDELVQLCSDIISRPTPNPPGDVRILAEFVTGLIEQRGLTVERYVKREDEPNLVARIGAAEAKPHLVICGHMDVFPVEGEDKWTLPPYSGAVVDGKIYGRGSSDMKGGFTGLLFAFLLLHDEKVELPGQLSFVAVSDEEDGGSEGAAWLFDAHPELMGDAGLIGEPNSVGQMSIANKGIASLRLVTEGDPRHGGLGDGTDAIVRLSKGLAAVAAIVDIEVPPPADMTEVIAEQIRLNRTGADERHQLGWLATRFGYTVGTIQGGLRFNVSAHRAVAGVDIRLPLGATLDDAVGHVRRLLDEAGRQDVEIEINHEMFYPPHHTSPDELLPRTVSDNVVQVRGEKPLPILTFPSGDIRNFRLRGVPGVVYGTDPHNVGGFDEYITVDDLVTITKVYVGTIIDYLHAAGGR